MTGASSGIGYQAALRLSNSGYKLTLPCRSHISSDNLRESLQKDTFSDNKFSTRIDTPLLDLADLRTVKECSSRLLLRDEPIDILILNAGLQYTGSTIPRWSSQNFELTFAVNHLGHYSFTQSIIPLLHKSKHPRIIVTASEVHNPHSPGGSFGNPASLGKLCGMKEGKGFSMIDGSDQFDADKAYKDSKLCNVLFAKELHRRLKVRGKSIPVIAWGPGLVIPRTETGFFRYSRKYNEFGQRFFSLIVRDLLRITESPEKAGELLSALATQSRYSEPVFSYYNNRVISLGRRSFDRAEIANEAKDDKLAESLWDLSAHLVEISRN